MSTLPRPTGKELVRALERAGFVVERMRGSHYFPRHYFRSRRIDLIVRPNRAINVITMTNTNQATQMNQTVAEIAARILGGETLATQNRDALDFHELAVWNIQRALEAAYEAGRAAR